MENEMNRTFVQRVLAGPIIERDGQWLCRVCDRPFARKTSVGVHELVHRRAVGMAPPPHKGNRAAPASLVCKYDGCPERMKRTSLRSHLLGQKHGLSPEAASKWARQRRDEEAGLLPVVAVEPEPEPRPPRGVLTDISAVEAVTGILSAARSDGVIPTRLLPAAFALVHHVEVVLEELRELSA